MLKKHNQKQILSLYKGTLVRIKQDYNISQYLTSKQKQILDRYISRCIRYCSSLRPLHKSSINSMKQDIISDINQYIEYNSIYKRLLYITSFISEETELEESYRNELLKLMGKMICHILGKMNCKMRKQIQLSAGDSGQM